MLGECGKFIANETLVKWTKVYLWAHNSRGSYNYNQVGLSYYSLALGTLNLPTNLPSLTFEGRKGVTTSATPS